MSTATRRKKPTALDKIVIRRPVPSPEVLQDLEPSAQPFTAVNPEFEQKPLAEFDARTSEEFHGGSEQTFSMPLQQGGGGGQQSKVGGGGAQQQARQAQEPDIGQAPKSELGSQQWGGGVSAQQRQELGGGSGQQEGGGAETGPKDVQQSGARQHGAGGAQRRESVGQSQESGQRQMPDAVPPHGEDAVSPRHGQQEEDGRPAEGGGEPRRPTPGGQESGEGDAARQRSAAARQGFDDKRGDAQQKSGSEGDGVQRQSQQQSVQQQVGDSAQQQDRRRWEEETDSAEERGDVRQLGRDVKTGGGSLTGVGVFNTAQVVDVARGSQKSDLRRLQTEFYRLLEMLAEEKTKQFDPSLVGGLVKAEYDVKKMALRRYEGKPPTKYKAPRVRESVVLVLDNSGSMVEWANMLRAMAELAAKRRDVEVYLAPNGYVEEQIAPVRRKVKHDDFMKKMSGRKVIYVGDFDGANTPIELSWRNEVIWIAPEGRYKRFLAHSWVKYDESKYKGAFIRAFNIDDVMKSLKKVIGGTRWIDKWIDSR